MNFTIAAYPASYLVVEMEEGEKILAEKGSLIYSDGDYTFENKIEISSYKNWIAKIVGGKSLSYASYCANEPLKMALAPKDNSEIFGIEMQATTAILFEPNLHFARTTAIELLLEKTDWKSTLNDGLKLKATGQGMLFLKGYGKIIKQQLATAKPIYVDEEALIAFEATLEVKTISKGVKELLTSGEGFLYSIKGEGTIWLQTREQGENTSSGGFVEGIFGMVK